ncbi:MAG: glutaredoxin family protein [Burkholderiales bacterium]
MRCVPHTLSIFAVALAALATAQAQTMYRSVGPDARVTYSDRAPTEPRTDSRAVAGASMPPPATLPHELREAASRHPVTLYTGNDCAPCVSARELLNSRGVPFSERTVTSNEEITALKTLSGSQSVPFTTIGGQKLKGFSDGEWRKYLDAAGYPAKSQLPPSFRQAVVAPLIEAKKVEPAAPSKAEAPSRKTAAPAVQPPATDNPAGIRF